MKVLHLITRLELGGAQQNTLFTCAELARRGHDVVLAAGPGGILDADAAAGPHRFVPVPSLVREIRPASDARALARIVSLLRAERPGVLHLHSSKAGVLGRLAGAAARVPVVIHSVHGWSFSVAGGASSVAYRALEHACAPLTDHFICVSRLDLELGLRLGIIREGRGTVIRSGFDLGEFAADGPGRDAVRREWGIADGDVLAVNVSNLKPQKAPLDFVRAAALAAPRAPALRFAYVGDGELRPQVEAAVREAGLADRFTLAGWRRDVPAVLRAADIVVLTSLWEGLPRTVVQARCAGKPVVATAVNGTPEVVDDGVTGLLVPPHAPEAVAGALVRLAGNSALREALGRAAARGLEEFAQERMVDEQEALYARLLALGARPPSVK